MKSELSIKRVLDAGTKKEEVVIGGTPYAIHMRQEEVILTDAKDFEKVVAVLAADFYDQLVKVAG